MVKWLSLPQYQKITGLSRTIIEQMIEEGQIIATKTEGGQWRIKVDENPEILELKEEVIQLKAMVKTLCTHLGVK